MVADVNWLTNLLSELGISIFTTLVVYYANVGATYVCVNQIFHSRMKHIVIDFHFVQDHMTTVHLQVAHVRTSAQLANSLTKPLPKHLFLIHRAKLVLQDGSPILQGHDRIPST